jgi:hypothetical protein
LIAAFAVFTAIGFLVGRFTIAREPFYYIGTPVESSSSAAPASRDLGSSQSIPSQETGVQGEQAVLSHAESESLCGARTKSGKPCRRKVKGGGYCWQHRDQQK